MTDIPPSRYRVVERGRRLVVIDTRTGQPATHGHDAPKPSGENARSRTTDGRSGTGMLTTSPFYDLKGPRQVAIDPAFGDRFGKAVGGWLVAILVIGTIVTLFFPMLWLLVIFALFQPKVRDGLRKWATARLDEGDQAS